MLVRGIAAFSWPFAIALLLGPTAVPAAMAEGQSPLVIGYERFHSDTPSLEGGRLLFNELGCVNCHERETSLPDRQGPTLSGVAQRIRIDWLKGFLLHPQSETPGSVMPALLHTTEEVESVIHFLGQLPSKTKPTKPFKFANAVRGKALYHEIGCVSCHAPSTQAQDNPSVGDVPEYPHIALPDLQRKYDFASLLAYVTAPLKTHPSGRMPDFQLDRDDAVDITAYLLDFQDSNTENAPILPRFNPDDALAAKGKALAQAKSCAACHDIPGLQAPSPLPITNVSRGCLSNAASSSIPRYPLTPQQRESLTLFLQASSIPPAPPAAPLQALNCLSCHERDGSGGPDTARRSFFAGDESLGDSGRLPPPLTSIGAKLQSDWLKKALQGKERMRPYLKTRMPVYGKLVEDLPRFLEQADRLPITLSLTDGDREAGRKLLGSEGGLNCIACHSWGERKSLGIQALDISSLARRLQPAWFHDYLVNPAAYRPNTLMPSFWPQGKASNSDILGGDTRSQIAAIYAFSQAGQGEPEGFPDQAIGDFEIVPEDQPVVMRTFLEGVGSHAILVGFPEGLHLAYDGLNGGPALMWKGKFFDAYSTWFSRAAPFEKPLGDDVVAWPAPEPSAGVRFLGYQLDAQGAPEFLLSIDGVEVVERFRPVVMEDQIVLQREIRYSGGQAPPDPRLAHPEVDVAETKSASPNTRTFIYRW